MRHNVDKKRFSRNSGHLRCMMANMTCDLILHGRIKTTTAKAKELRRYAEKMITLGKAGDTAARRRAMAFMRRKEAVKRLFNDVSPVFKSRNGGYTRITKCGVRAGDCSPMSIIEFVENDALSLRLRGVEAATEEKATKKAAPKKAAEKKPATKEAAPKKAAPKKPTEKKTAAKEVKKPAAKKPAGKKPVSAKATKKTEK